MENELAGALTERFPELSDRVRVERPGRVTVDWLTQEEFLPVIRFLHDGLGLTRGHNVIGTDEKEDLGFVYLISGPQRVIAALHTRVPKSDPRIRSMTDLYPMFLLFERELVDLFGAVVEGLPQGRRYPLPDKWPRDQWPLRKEWDPAGVKEAMARQPADLQDPAHRLSEEEEKEPSNLVTVPIGPQHPSLDEPGSFAITLEGERVRGAEIEIGYNHRGLEKACESRTYVQDLYIIERVCGICSLAHTTAYCMAVEQLAGVEVPIRAQYIRLIAAEMERLHSHLLWLGVAAHEIGFDTLFMLTWRDRESVLDVMAVLGGNRINYGVNCLGGVRRDIDAELEQEILRVMDFLETEVQNFMHVADTEATLKARLVGVGPLSREDCLHYGATGPVARAAGVSEDVRVVEPYGAYREIAVNDITDDHADVYGRTVVRMKEMLESIRLIREALKRLPEGPLTVRVPRRIPAGEAIVRVEAPRGENIHFVRSDGSDTPDRVRVRAPTECNWHGMQHMLQGGYLSDVPITIAAIDPCYSCTDRAITLRGRDGKPLEVMDWGTLRQHGIQWYARRGIDISKVVL